MGENGGENAKSLHIPVLFHFLTEVCLLLVRFKNRITRDFPGGPVVKTSSSNAGGAGSIPGQGVEIPHAWRPKN